MRCIPTVGVILMSLLSSISIHAETKDTLSLVSNSPFLPPGFQPPGTAGKPAAPPATSNQFEFRGVYQLGGTFYFNLYDVRERKASWLTEDSADEMNLSIMSFDPEENELSLNVDGKPISLSLVATSDKVLPVQTAPANPVTQPSKPAAEKPTTQPVRRRVIRPTTRAGNSSSNTAARRRVIRPAR